MKNRLAKWMGVCLIILLVNTAYVAAFSTASVFYMTNVLIHLGLGLALSIGLVFLLRKDSALRSGIPAAVGLFAIAVILALYLVKAGNTTDHRWAFWSHHPACGVLGLAALIPYAGGSARKTAADGSGSRPHSNTRSRSWTAARGRGALSEGVSRPTDPHSATLW